MIGSLRVELDTSAVFGIAAKGHFFLNLFIFTMTGVSAVWQA